jgi:hypothetical protein
MKDESLAKAQRRGELPVTTERARRDGWASQCTGNAGEHYVAYRLSLMDYQVAMTAKNAAGVDLMIYHKERSTKTVQVKTVRKLNAFGMGARQHFADWIVGVVIDPPGGNGPDCYIFSQKDITQIYSHQDERRAQKGLNIDSARSRWIETADYRDNNDFKNRWERLEQ